MYIYIYIYVLYKYESYTSNNKPINNKQTRFQNVPPDYMMFKHKTFA